MILTSGVSGTWGVNTIGPTVRIGSWMAGPTAINTLRNQNIAAVTRRPNANEVGKRRLVMADPRSSRGAPGELCFGPRRQLTRNAR
jgi:hypothetical protein